MSFYIQSIETKDKDSFEIDIYDIKKYLCEVGNTYLLIAYRVYEMDLNQNYKKHNYKNIVEACQSELGWKKSTTYNMINIVKRFGEIEYGRISYNSLFSNVNEFSYSQLCEMLSLSDKQIENVTPHTTIKELRQMKKVQTSGKIKEDESIIDVEAEFIISENGIEEVTNSLESAPVPEPDIVSADVTLSAEYRQLKIESNEIKEKLNFWIKAHSELKEENQQLRADRVTAMNRADNAEKELAKFQTSGKDKYILSLSSSEMLFLNKLINLGDVFYTDLAGLIRKKMIKAEYEWDYDCVPEGFEMRM